MGIDENKIIDMINDMAKYIMESKLTETSKHKIVDTLNELNVEIVDTMQYEYDIQKEI
jgi:hypothetical protein